MATYTVTNYDSAAALAAAIVLLETTTTFDVVEYKEGCKTKFKLISPAPNKAT